MGDAWHANKQGDALDRANEYLENFNKRDLDACLAFFHPDVRVVLLQGACGDDGPAEDTVVAHGVEAIKEGHQLEFDEVPNHEKVVDYSKASLTPDGTHVLVSYTAGRDRHKVTYILDAETNTKCICRVVHEITATEDARRRSVA